MAKRWADQDDREPTPQAVLDAWSDWFNDRCTFAAYLERAQAALAEAKVTEPEAADDG